MTAPFQMRRRSLPEQIRYWSRRLREAEQLFGPEVGDERVHIIGAAGALEAIANELDPEGGE